MCSCRPCCMHGSTAAAAAGSHDEPPAHTMCPCCPLLPTLLPTLLQNGPSISLYLTFFGILLGFLSIFWSFGEHCAASLNADGRCSALSAAAAAAVSGAAPIQPAPWHPPELAALPAGRNSCHACVFKFCVYPCTHAYSGYVRLSRKLRAFLEAPNLDVAPKIRRSDVITMLERVRAAGMPGGSARCMQWPGALGLLLPLPRLVGTGLPLPSGFPPPCSSFPALASPCPTGRHHQRAWRGADHAGPECHHRRAAGQDADQRHRQPIPGHQLHQLEPRACV